MKSVFQTCLILLFLSATTHLKAQPGDFSDYPVYEGNDLGLIYHPTYSQFRVWAPQASALTLQLYKSDTAPVAEQVISLQKDRQGTWMVQVDRDLEGYYYTFRARYKRHWSMEVPDPYAKACGVNGKRAQVVNLQATNPPGWDQDVSPRFDHKNDAIIYELHVRDLSIHPSSGIQHKGKYLALTERNTRNDHGDTTGLDHISSLGVTHVHLLPVFEFRSIDESKLDVPQYNWGYDPVNYNIPDGSYSTDPSNGAVRIREFKQMVQAMHQAGLRVVMDVVYNHTAHTEKSLFNQLVPGYYYRQTEDGGFSNASACGNETASERPMMRKFIMESLLYWVKEYHIDGFRFDLMGIHDIKTMNMVADSLYKIRPDLLLYGEGWAGGSSPLPESVRAVKHNVSQLHDIAVFSDDIRDALKGSVFRHEEGGFISGKPGLEESVKFGIVASLPHPQVNYSHVNYSNAPYAREPFHTITYVECHDNHVLWDKLSFSAKHATEADRLNMYKLAQAVVLTSQGIAFIHAGSEMLRTKQGVENSFESPDSINAIDWNWLHQHRDIHQFQKQLIRLRKEHPAFRLRSANDVSHLIHFNEVQEGFIRYTIHGAAAGDSWKEIQVILNGSNREHLIRAEGWKFAMHNNSFVEKDAGNELHMMAPHTCTILFKPH